MLYRIKRLAKYTSLSVILSTMIPAVAFCGGLTVNGTVKQAWNAPTSQVTDNITHTLTTGCVGDSLAGCAVWPKGMPPKNYKDNKCDLTNHGTGTRQGTIMMLVGRKVNSRGAEFCVTQIQAINQSYTEKIKRLRCATDTQSGAWTGYYYPVGAEKECFWMCKDGYYGEECKYDKPQNCSDKRVSAQTFEGYERVTSGGKDVDSTIEMFDRGTMIGSKANSDYGEEYDTILAVTQFLPNGNGAKVAPVVVRAYKTECHKWDSGKILTCYDNLGYTSTPYLKTVGEESVVCKDGYRVENGTCVASDFCSAQEAALEESKRNPCGTNQWTQFDETQHYKELSNDKTCFTYTCKGSKGFTSITDHKCIECNGNQRRVNVAPNGVCIKCPVGYVYDGENERNDYCSPAKKVPLETLLYGSVDQDTTKANRAPARIADQCWTFTDEQEYKACVTDSITAAKQLTQKRLAPTRE
ncbi:MAG: hypothetical protein J5679_03385 [Alphaproteobacteria bacterium]|nr:hypothetical protein [Alphaproteobacteria bacterium]